MVFFEIGCFLVHGKGFSHQCCCPASSQMVTERRHLALSGALCIAQMILITAPSETATCQPLTWCCLCYYEWHRTQFFLCRHAVYPAESNSLPLSRFPATPLVLQSLRTLCWWQYGVNIGAGDCRLLLCSWLALLHRGVIWQNIVMCIEKVVWDHWMKSSKTCFIQSWVFSVL